MSQIQDRSLFGEFQNVHLSIVEHQKLTERYGSAATGDYIERLSCWLKNTRKRRTCHYACILTWIRKDATIQAFTPPLSPAPSLLDEMEQQHRAQCLQRVRIREGLTPNDIDSCLRAIKELDGDRRGF